MKVWRLVAVSALLASASRAADTGAEQIVKDQAGKTLAVVVLCSDCQSPPGESKACHTGTEDGWLNGKRCGKCLLSANPQARYEYGQDLHLTGRLIDAEGAPVKNRFVKLYMTNGWTVRTRTSDEGAFRLMLGATVERSHQAPVVTDLGAHVDVASGSGPDYAVFLLPDGYKPCLAGPKERPAQRKKKH